ncbi:hypothetical protein M3J09_013772 [Ascochyta lentis]
MSFYSDKKLPAMSKELVVRVLGRLTAKASNMRGPQQGKIVERMSWLAKKSVCASEAVCIIMFPKKAAVEVSASPKIFPEAVIIWKGFTKSGRLTLLRQQFHWTP